MERALVSHQCNPCLILAWCSLLNLLLVLALFAEFFSGSYDFLSYFNKQQVVRQVYLFRVERGGEYESRVRDPHNKHRLYLRYFENIKVYKTF